MQVHWPSSFGVHFAYADSLIMCSSRNINVTLSTSIPTRTLEITFEIVPKNNPRNVTENILVSKNVHGNVAEIILGSLTVPRGSILKRLFET